MNYWIVKSPFKHHPWSEVLFKYKFTLFGIRNFQSCNNINYMQPEDRILFYLSSNGRKLFGIMKVKSNPYKDPSTSDERWLACDFIPVETFEPPIHLQTLKKIPELKETAFIKQPRVSVVKINKSIFDKIISLRSKLL